MTVARIGAGSGGIWAQVGWRRRAAPARRWRTAGRRRRRRALSTELDAFSIFSFHRIYGLSRPSGPCPSGPSSLHGPSARPFGLMTDTATTASRTSVSSYILKCQAPKQTSEQSITDRIKVCTKPYPLSTSRSKMPLLLGRLAAGAVSSPLRSSLCTAASRPPWAMVYSRAALDASAAAPSPGARATIDLDAAPYISQISVPAHLADGMDFAGASVRATSSDGLLLLDLAEVRHGPLAPPDVPEHVDSAMVHQIAAAGAATELDVTRFVCNPLSGQLFRLPIPDPAMGVANTGTAFGLLTQPDGGSHGGPPGRFVVAQLGRRAGDRRAVVRRFLSETGEWDERLPINTLFRSVTQRMPRLRPWQIHTSHDVLAFGDRLWWFDATWGAFSVDPFSDRPDVRFVELPPGSSLLSNIETKDKMLLGKRRIMGVSEGKLRYVELCTEKEPFLIRSFTLDDEGCSWKLTRQSTLTVVLPNKAKPQADHLPWIAGIHPFNADVLYFDLGHTVFAMDMAKKKAIESRSCRDNKDPCAFFLPCMLPPWLQSTYIPSAAGIIEEETLSSKKTNRGRKTLADILVRAD